MRDERGGTCERASIVGPDDFQKILQGHPFNLGPDWRVPPHLIHTPPLPVADGRVGRRVSKRLSKRKWDEIWGNLMGSSLSEEKDGRSEVNRKATQPSC